MRRASTHLVSLFAALAPFFCAAQAATWCQTVPPPYGPPPRTVTVENVVYQIGEPECIAPTPVGDVVLHPTGRYALIVQEMEERTANAAPNGKPIFGAVALLLYDAKLHKTRAVWKRRATTKGAQVYPSWLPKTNCAIATTDEFPAPPQHNSKPGEKTPDALNTLLFFNFATSLTPRLLATSPYDFLTSVSPTEPLFLEWELGESTARMGSVPRGTLGPVLQTLDFEFKSWSSDGKTVYGREFFVNQYDTPPRNEAERQERLNAKTESALQWYKWDGIAHEATKIPAPRAMAINPDAAPLPVLPLALRTAFLPVPLPSAENAQILSTTAAPIAVIRPLFFEASRTGTVNGDRPNHIAFVAPDATEAYLLPDLSAVLYKAGGGLYAVSLTRRIADVVQIK